LAWCATAIGVARAGARAPLPEGLGPRSRLLVVWLYLVQPLVRGWHRHATIVGRRRLPRAEPDEEGAGRQLKPIGLDQFDLYWESDEGLGRDQLIESLVREAERTGWSGEFGNDWAPWDLMLLGDCWHDVTIRTATEELGWPDRFTRARCSLQLAPYGRAACLVASVWAVWALWSMKTWAIWSAAAALAACLAAVIASRHRCRRAVGALLGRSGRHAGLVPVGGDGGRGVVDVPPEPGPVLIPPLVQVRLSVD
ncbi:MAG TPA: hypothetical protein VGH33_11830, partial [Isosphaeraceae bacterium]